MVVMTAFADMGRTISPRSNGPILSFPLFSIHFYINKNFNSFCVSPHYTNGNLKIQILGNQFWATESEILGVVSQVSDDPRDFEKNMSLSNIILCHYIYF